MVDSPKWHGSCIALSVLRAKAAHDSSSCALALGVTTILIKPIHLHLVFRIIASEVNFCICLLGAVTVLVWLRLGAH